MEHDVTVNEALEILRKAVRKLVDDWRTVLGRPIPAYAGVRRAGNEEYPLSSAIFWISSAS